MFLTPENVVGYLVARGVLETEAVVSQNVSVTDSSRRNRNFKIELANRNGLFVKQIPAVFTETVGSIYREAACYDLGLSDPSFASLQPYIAPLVDYDPRQHTLTTELLPDAENLNVFHVRTKEFPAEIGAAQGIAMGAVHRAQAGVSDPTSIRAFPRMQPWVLTIAQTAESVFTNMGPATRDLVDILRRNPTLVRGLYALSTVWRQETLIHGDIKWDNFVLVRSDSDPAAPKLRMVDWELSDIGDSSWDAGCAFCCYLQHWLATMSADASCEETISLILKAPHRIESIWPALQALWKAYSQTRGFSQAEDWRELRRAAAFSAGRLVLTAFEMTIRMPNIPRTATLCLQLATAMMESPEIALRDILGFADRQGGN